MTVHPDEPDRGSVPRPVTRWTTGRITSKDLPGPRLVRLRLAPGEHSRHLPGQHYVVRLRAPDGYTAQRAYSIASDPDDDELELLVERFEDGEVSTFLADDAEVGDELELRGPLGGWFTWDLVTPAVCLVGGTGVVPAISMLRAAARAGVTDRIRVLAVGRSPVELPYADELRERGGTLAFTRHALPDRPAGPPTVAEVGAAATGAGIAFVCGSARFATLATGLLAEDGFPAARTRIEQFGPTG